MLRLTLLTTALCLTACKNELRVSVSVPQGLDPGQVHVVAAGTPLSVRGQPYLETNWPADLAPASDSVEVELEARLPCGTRHFKVKPTKGQPIGKTEVLLADFTTELGPTVDLILDPALEGQLALGEFQLPTPFPATLQVAWGDCPREVVVAGTRVPLPETTGRILLAKSADRCFLQGVAMYGVGCGAESSNRLTGSNTYVLTERFDLVLKDLPAKIDSRNKCSPLRYLQVCR